MKFPLKIVIILVFSLGLIPPARADDLVQCKSKPWPISRNLSIPQIHTQLDKISRVRIIQMLWGEMLANRADSMALPLDQYLANTEVDHLLRGYYLALGANITGGQESATKALQKWPARPSYHNNRLNLSGLCFAFKASHGKLK